MTESYLAVAGRIRREVEQIEDVVDRAQAIWADVDLNRPADHRIDAVALNLHGFYAGLERVFKIVAERIDQTVPEGGSWHQELLEQMNTELNGVRPSVLSDDARKKLDRYRGFRHVVRNVYAFEFDPEQLDLLMRKLPETAERVFADLQAFADTLDRLASQNE
ncbi:hypothetical protein GGQ21_002663 [Salinibacter ruber]|uniref:ribonuclease toxin HepT-like protein n=1 Tax=Salinibacter TaxID=146918 RepID=UPI002073B970|nr:MULTISPECIES: antitoxin [Salinibacter]MCS3671993.1 hypothetical protein [Salinibacter ruber]